MTKKSGKHSNNGFPHKKKGPISKIEKNAVKECTEISTSLDTTKLTKQERRNLNKAKKAGQINNTDTVMKANQVESVYKRETEYPPQITNYQGPWKRFVSPSDKEFETVMKTCYNGFIVTPAKDFKASFHDEFRSAMEGLETEGYYQYDITQPAGLNTKLAKTFVTRCLVGEAGTTYKYLGLRMFSIPWNATSTESLKDTPTTSRHAVAIGRVNQFMIQHSEKLLNQSGKKKIGSCQYNLTLINR